MIVNATPLDTGLLERSSVPAVLEGTAMSEKREALPAARLDSTGSVEKRQSSTYAKMTTYYALSCVSVANTDGITPFTQYAPVPNQCIKDNFFISQLPRLCVGTSIRPIMQGSSLH